MGFPEDKASCKLSGHSPSNGIWAYKIRIWQPVAYKKSELLRKWFHEKMKELT